MGYETDEPRPGFDHWESYKGHIDWMKQQQDGRPFFVYLSHKAVHDAFLPAKRHKGSYVNETGNRATTAKRDCIKNLICSIYWVC